MTTYEADGVQLTPYQCLGLASKAIGRKIILPTGGLCEAVIVEPNTVMVRYLIRGHVTSKVLIFIKDEEDQWKMSESGRFGGTPTFRELRTKNATSEKETNVDPGDRRGVDGRGETSKASTEREYFNTAS